MRKVHICVCVLTLAFLTAHGSAQDSHFSRATSSTRYTLYDLGTLGGNFSGFFNTDYTGGDFTPSALNQRGQLAGIALDASGFAGSFVWRNGTLVPLPTLPNGNQGGGGSNAFGINDPGLVVGISNDGQVSPFNNQLYNHAVTWTGQTIHRLPDLGGSDSGATYVNDQGLVVGYAYNPIPDSYSYYGTQLHAATWRNGAIQDLGTLGGTDSEGWTANPAGQVIGISFLDTPPVPPFNQPQDDAFLWTNGTMTDLGTLGGGFSSPTAINRNSEVAVLSFDSTNQFVQSFLWANGCRTSLASLGGNYVEALTLNDKGRSVGASTDVGDTNFVAAAWNRSGTAHALGTVVGDSGSVALGINNHGTIVGGSGSITLSGSSYVHAFVWQNGELSDLNTLIPTGSSLALNVAYTINQNGDIAGFGTTSSGDTHAFILVPTSVFDVGAIGNAQRAAPGSSIRVPSLVENISRGIQAEPRRH